MVAQVRAAKTPTDFVSLVFFAVISSLTRFA
jgi:hypothetical protein